jgi:hypothetical protein
VAPYVSIDAGLTAARVASLAFESRDVRSNDVSLFTMPTTGTGNVGGQSIVVVDQTQLALIKAALQKGTFHTYTPPPPTR